jgi:enediyne biosynthesis protein E4
VINNINKEAFVFINNSIEPTQPIKAHYLKIDLKGTDLNKKGIGTKVFVHTKGSVQTQEQNPVRGYFSSVDQQLFFGLGNVTKVDSVVVIWPDNKKQSITGIAADTLLTVNYTNALAIHNYTISSTAKLFVDVSGRDGLGYRHIENEFNDFAFQPLLPHKYSQLGPFITTGDVNNDGETDFFIGGGFSYSGKIFTQHKGASFSSINIADSVKINEDMDCVFFDADKDGDQDLLVSIADIQYEPNSQFYTPHLYLNDSKGNFTISPKAIPASVKVIGAAVCATDYDMDGDVDLFIGGRVANRYPETPQSYILENNNGSFTDVTEKICPELKKAGMVTAAVWTDINNDKKPDLIIAGEWMPIRFFINQQSKFIETTAQTGLTAMEGMWRSLVATDIDNDGDQDLVAGNLGLNCEYAVSTDSPMQVFAGDIDGNGTIDPVPFYYIKGKDGNRYSYPSISRGMFASQVPSIKKRFLLNSEYAAAGFDEVFKGKTKKDFLELSCTETRSCYFENTGNGKFIKHVLPVEAQFAPINSIIADDLDNDGYTDLIVAGNEYQMDVMTGRFDASFGLFLRGTKGKGFLSEPSNKSGLLLRGDVKDMAIIKKTSGEKILLAAVNNDSLRVFRINK